MLVVLYSGFSTLQIGSLIEAARSGETIGSPNVFQYPSNRVVDRSRSRVGIREPRFSRFQYPSNRVVDRSPGSVRLSRPSRLCFSTLQIGSLIEADHIATPLRCSDERFSTLQIGSLIEAPSSRWPRWMGTCFSTLQIGSLIEASKQPRGTCHRGLVSVPFKSGR